MRGGVRVTATAAHTIAESVRPREAPTGTAEAVGYSVGIDHGAPGGDKAVETVFEVKGDGKLEVVSVRELPPERFFGVSPITCKPLPLHLGYMFSGSLDDPKTKIYALFGSWTDPVELADPLRAEVRRWILGGLALERVIRRVETERARDKLFSSMGVSENRLRKRVSESRRRQSRVDRPSLSIGKESPPRTRGRCS